MKRHGVPQGPRRERQSAANRRQRQELHEKTKSPLSQPHKSDRHPCQNKQKRRLRTKKRTHPNQKTARERKYRVGMARSPHAPEKRGPPPARAPKQADHGEHSCGREENRTNLGHRNRREIQI